MRSECLYYVCASWSSSSPSTATTTMSDDWGNLLWGLDGAMSLTGNWAHLSLSCPVVSAQWGDRKIRARVVASVSRLHVSL